MRSLFGNFSLVKNDDAVCLHQRGDAVRNENDCRIAGSLLQPMADFRIGLGIHGRKRIIKNHDRRLSHEHLCDCRPLLLAARKRDAAFADRRIVAVGQRHDVVVDVGALCGGDQFFLADLARAVGDVVADGGVEQEDVL